MITDRWWEKSSELNSCLIVFFQYENKTRAKTLALVLSESLISCVNLAMRFGISKLLQLYHMKACSAFSTLEKWDPQRRRRMCFKICTAPQKCVVLSVLLINLGKLWLLHTYIKEGPASRFPLLLMTKQCHWKERGV